MLTVEKDDSTHSVGWKEFERQVASLAAALRQLGPSLAIVSAPYCPTSPRR